MQPALVFTCLLVALTVAPGWALPLTPQLELTILDGKANSAPVSLTDKGDLVATAASVPTGPVTLWRVELADQSHKPRWLELVLTGRFGRGPRVHYFSGTAPLELGDQPYEQPGYRQALPLAALWDDGGGLALGLEPHETVSYVRHTAQVRDGQAQMSLHLRLVLDPGQTRTVQLLSSALSGKWGFHEALSRFYDLAPDIYDINPEVDPRLRLASAQYCAWGAGPDTAEFCRRNFAGWDWCYAPFKRTGDIVGRPELWDYVPARPFGKGKPLDSAEKFHAWRRDNFARGEHSGVAMLFYVPAQVWCEERIANERYADALGTDPQTKNYFNTPWCTGHDNELRVFPWKTSFGAQSVQDLREVARELDLAGFAFDTCEGTSRYFGPHVREFPERAWDEKLGEYVREAVGTAELRGFIHTLTNSRGHQLGVIGNTDLPFYLIARHIDGGLREAAPWSPERGTGDTQRYMMGRKPMVWWQGYDFADLVQYERMTPAQMADAYISLSDFVMLECFRVAYYPTVDYTRGVAGAVAALPALKDCLDAGWQPVPAATVEGAAFVTRYGKGLSTRLATGNETLDPATAALTVDNSWLQSPREATRVSAPESLSPIAGEAAFVFAAGDGQPLRNLLAGATTRVEGVSVAPRRVGVLRAVACFTPPPDDLTVTATYGTSLEGARITLQLSQPVRRETTLRVPGRRECMATSEVDGRPQPASTPVGAPSVALSLAPGQGRTITVRLQSARYLLTEQELASFPFVSPEGKQAATIVIRPGATDEEKRAADRLADYFRYYYAGAPEQPLPVTLPIREGPAPAAGPQITLDTGGRLRAATGPTWPVQVRREGSHLVVSTAGPEQMLPAILDLLGQLDRKYVYPGPLPWRYHTNALGMVGRYIGLDGQVHGPVASK